MQARGAETAGNVRLELPLFSGSLVFRWRCVERVELVEVVGLECAQDHGLRHSHQFETLFALRFGFVEQGIDDIGFVGGPPLGERCAVSACGICCHCALTLSPVTCLAAGLISAVAVVRGRWCFQPTGAANSAIFRVSQWASSVEAVGTLVLLIIADGIRLGSSRVE